MSQQTDNTPPRRLAAGREWRTLGVVAAAALAVRAVLFIGWLSSPLRNFHLVPGLDMQSLLRYGAWDTGAVRPLFSLHRVLIASIRLCCGAEHLVETLAVIQLLCGTATAVLTAYAAFRLWGRRRAALAAGLIAAFYAPAAMYELSMLQETLQLFAFTASLAGILWARKHGFSLSHALTAGALLGLASCGRPTALLWVFAALAWCGYAAWRRGGCAGSGLSPEVCWRYGCSSARSTGIFRNITGRFSMYSAIPPPSMPPHRRRIRPSPRLRLRR